MFSISQAEINTIISRVLASRKYRTLGIPPETLLDLITRAASQARNVGEVENIVKEKMHNLVAPYLGEPDYVNLQQELALLPGAIDSPELQDFCLKVLQAHASTRERILLLKNFYKELFQVTGNPTSIIDLACGLNPFSIPWMHLQPGTSYFAYDLHQPRIQLISAFLNHIGQFGEAIHTDILVDPPRHPVDVAFFFKEAHRFEQRQRGVNTLFFQSVPARFLLVSLPVASLTGRRSMLDQDRRLIERSLDGLAWQVTEILFENEIVFCIEKGL